jgi:hypothetical protein
VTAQANGAPIGLQHRQTITVDADFTVPAVSPAFPAFRDMPGFHERAIIDAPKFLARVQAKARRPA